jgi:hypothetical protein
MAKKMKSRGGYEERSGRPRVSRRAHVVIEGRVGRPSSDGLPLLWGAGGRGGPAHFIR